MVLVGGTLCRGQAKTERHALGVKASHPGLAAGSTSDTGYTWTEKERKRGPGGLVAGIVHRKLLAPSELFGALQGNSTSIGTRAAVNIGSEGKAVCTPTPLAHGPKNMY